MPKQKLTPEIIVAAIAGFEAQKKRIDEQVAALRATLSGRGSGTVAAPGRQRRLSAAGRRAIAEAARKRWAALRAAKAAAKSSKRPRKVK